MKEQFTQGQMKEKFTQGHWSTSYKKDISGMYSQVVFDAGGESICKCSWYPIHEGNGVTTTNREANAHLIAAAPKMYRMLKECYLSHNRGAFKDELGELLAEARGENKDTD